MNIPKQIDRWAYKAGLRYSHPQDRWMLKSRGACYFTGRGRRWRVRTLSDGVCYMDISSTDFDRWANSTEHTIILPWCEKDFVETVKWIGKQ